MSWSWLPWHAYTRPARARRGAGARGSYPHSHDLHGWLPAPKESSHHSARAAGTIDFVVFPKAEYERLRLERIKANAELLSKLGLEALPFER